MSDLVLVLNSGSSCFNKIERETEAYDTTHDKMCKSVVNARRLSEGRKQHKTTKDAK